MYTSAGSFRESTGSHGCAQSRQELGRVGHGPKNTSLRRNHAERRRVKVVAVRGAAVGYNDAVVAPIVGLADRRVHAHFRRDAAHEERRDAPGLQNAFQVRGVKRALLCCV